MNARYYIGLEVHKKKIAVCVKEANRAVVSQQTVEAILAARPKNNPGQNHSQPGLGRGQNEALV